MKEQLRILISGTFDVNNYGDCLFPDVLLFQLRKRMPDKEITYDLFSPYPITANIGNYDNVLELPGTPEECKKLRGYDCQILAGGEVLQAGHGPKSLYCKIPIGTMSAGMRLWMVPTLLKLYNNTPSIMNGVGVGKLSTEIASGLASAITISDNASLRDANSLKKIRSYCPDFSCPVKTDSVFTIKDLKTEYEWLNRAKTVLPKNCEPGSYIVVQPRLQYLAGNTEAWAENVVKIANTMESDILLLPICYHHSDHAAIDGILKAFKGRGKQLHYIKEFIKTDQTAAVISQSNGYTGTSLHGTITAIAFEKAIAVLAPKGGKYDGVLEQIGAEACVTEQADQLHETFSLSLEKNRQTIAKRAYEIAHAMFDEISEILTQRASHSSEYHTVNDTQKDQIMKAIEHDMSHYKRHPSDKIYQKIFSSIRDNPFLYNAYEKFSALKKRR